ncbi:hypothetical protein [Planktotalea sp.]|uniref:hypothetical protein n=1 Tax=Planktotalea sp. TaxID=2029877 RepID=UPI0025ECB687|nr:hypothetical protein [Planktotalea sp.]
MPRYNTQFELTVEDLDVIENALREVKTKMSNDALAANTDNAPQSDEVSQIHDLLGRLHNQKVFYRPKNGTYISG